MPYKYFYIIIFCLFTSVLSSQTKLNKAYAGNGQDSSSTKRSRGFKERATIDMYLQMNNTLDSIQVDTTLTVNKNYKFNYLQKDNFNLLSFANIGQTYNTLSYNSVDDIIIPLLGVGLVILIT